MSCWNAGPFAGTDVRSACLGILAIPALTALTLVTLAGPAAAQSPEQPQLIIGMTGGFLTGPRLWRLDRQPVPVTWSGAIDSVSLQRLFRTGFVVGVGATLYRSPHIGYTVEVAFLGLPTESRCAPLGPYSYDPVGTNEQTCMTVQGRGISTSATTFQAGMTWRARPHTALQPYLRGMAGVAVLGGSFVTAEGVYALPVLDSTVLPTIHVRSLLDEPKPRTLTWVATLAAGVSLEVNPGNRVRFEVRDEVIDLPTATGPANPTFPLSAQVGSRIVHLPAFTVSLDLLLERARTRRY
jgi:hypothetical protein